MHHSPSSSFVDEFKGRFVAELESSGRVDEVGAQTKNTSRCGRGHGYFLGKHS